MWIIIIIIIIILVLYMTFNLDNVFIYSLFYDYYIIFIFIKNKFKITDFFFYVIRSYFL